MINESLIININGQFYMFLHMSQMFRYWEAFRNPNYSPFLPITNLTRQTCINCSGLGRTGISCDVLTCYKEQDKLYHYTVTYQLKTT